MAFNFPNNPTVGQQTSNTGSGQVFTWDGVSWNTAPVTASISVSSSLSQNSVTASYSLGTGTMFRDYFPTRSFISYNWRSAFATPAQLGVTAVGGATVGWYNSGGLYGNNSMLQCNATQATTKTAEYTVPTSYLRVEMPSVASVSNVFSFTTITDRSSWVQIDCWICDPITGNPVKKLLKNVTEIVTAAATNFSKTTYMDPWGGYGQFSNMHIWMNYSIPQDLVNLYRSSTGTIKLALRPGMSNAEGNLWYIGGLAMTPNPYNFININGGTQNQMFSPAYGNAPAFDNANWNWRELNRIDVGTVGTIYVPIMDETKPMILCNIFAGELTQGFGLQYQEWSLVAPNSSATNLGRPKKSIIAPSYLNQNNYTFAVGGWIITPEQQQQYKIPATTWDANSGYSYLRLTSSINYQNTTYLSGLIAESLY